MKLTKEEKRAVDASKRWSRRTLPIPHRVVQELHWSDVADPWQCAAFVAGYLAALRTPTKRKAQPKGKR